MRKFILFIAFDLLTFGAQVSTPTKDNNKYFQNALTAYKISSFDEVLRFFDFTCKSDYTRSCYNFTKILDSKDSNPKDINKSVKLHKKFYNLSNTLGYYFLNK